MPKIAYSEEERSQIREALIATGLELFVNQGIAHTTVEQIYQRVGISRTFFYTFFPSKEELVVQAFLLQQPKIINLIRTALEDPGLSWRDAAKQFLRGCCYAGNGSFVVTSAEEQQAIFKRLSKENYDMLRSKQQQFFSDILTLLGVPADEKTVKLLGNLVLSMAVVRRGIPDSLPFLFSEAADEMTEFQIDVVLNYIERLRDQGLADSKDAGI